MSRWRLVSTYFRKWNAFANDSESKSTSRVSDEAFSKAVSISFGVSNISSLESKFQIWNIFTQSQREQREIRSRHHRRQAQMTALLREKNKGTRKRDERKRREKKRKVERQRKEVEEKRQQKQVVKRVLKLQWRDVVKRGTESVWSFVICT